MEYYELYKCNAIHFKSDDNVYEWKNNKWVYVDKYSNIMFKRDVDEVTVLEQYDLVNYAKLAYSKVALEIESNYKMDDSEDVKYNYDVLTEK